MPATYDFQPVAPAPVYINQHTTYDPVWGTVMPDIIGLSINAIANGIKVGQSVTNNPVVTDSLTAAQAQGADLFGINDAVKGIEDYLQKNQLNYIVGIVGLLLISAAVFQVVKP